MIAPPSLISFSARSRSLPKLVLAFSAIFVLAVRALETPPSLALAVRVVVSVLTIGFVCFSSYKTFARRAIVVLACEALVGLIAFAFVDLPFVLDHRQQIGTMAIAISDSVAGRERAAMLGR